MKVRGGPTEKTVSCRTKRGVGAEKAKRFPREYFNFGMLPLCLWQMSRPVIPDG